MGCCVVRGTYGCVVCLVFFVPAAELFQKYMGGGGGGGGKAEKQGGAI